MSGKRILRSHKVVDLTTHSPQKVMAQQNSKLSNKVKNCENKLKNEKPVSQKQIAKNFISSKENQSSNKIDFPGQQPLFKQNQSKRQRKDPDTIIKLNLEDSDSSHGSWISDDARPTPDKKEADFDEKQEKNEKQKQIKIHQDQSPKQSSPDFIKKRDLKKEAKQIQEIQINRRSSRLEKVQKEGGIQRSMYTLDNMNQYQYQNQLVSNEIQKQEKRMIAYAIQRSLLNETKYKENKELQTEGKQWFKNFINEQEPIVNIDYLIESKMKESNENQIVKPKSQSHSPNIEQNEKAKNDENTKQKVNLKKVIQDNQEETQTKQRLVDEKEETPEKRQDTNIDLQELIDESVQKSGENSNTKKNKNEFLEPLPVVKNKKLSYKQSVQAAKEKDVVLDVINPIDLNIRKQFTQLAQFVDFKNQTTENMLYKPALIQKIQQERKEQNENEENNSQSVNTGVSTVASSEINSQISLSQGYQQKDSSKSHFIKKKQTSCNVKRACGVSYIKESESHQLNVLHKGYEKLPPIAIQGSYTLSKSDKNYQDPKVLDQVKQTIENLFFANDHQILVVTAFESINENQMKNYLLKNEQRLKNSSGKYWLVRKAQGDQTVLDNLWKFIKDKYFLCIHFKYDAEHLLQTIQIDPEKPEKEQIQHFVTESDIQIGILPKKGNASVKSMLKVYKLENMYDQHMHSQDTSKFSVQKLINCEGAQISGINTIAYLSRLELYVSETKWKNASMFQKWSLTNFIDQFEDSISNVLLQWNKHRTEMTQTPDNEVNIRFVLLQSEEQKVEDTSKKWDDLSEDFGKTNSIETQKQDWNWAPNENDPIDILNLLRKSGSFPITLINTRDCFAYDLKYTEDLLELDGRKDVVKKEYHFDPDIDQGYPENFKQVLGYTSDTNMKEIENLMVGVTCYENFFSPEELDEIESLIEQTEERSLDDQFLPMTAQKTFTGTTLKRTKFFFGYRYMWTKTQLQDPLANVAAGVRADVSPQPVWMKQKIEDKMVKAGVVEKGFINSVALNVYHDGSEGLAQHFDDATRFKQPIYTIRTFSDSRLSFGSQYYGFQNGAYTIPLPRGCICIMQEGSYSANGVKHCIRPCDMTGKSSAVIMRQMHPNVIQEAEKLDRHIDLPMWLSSLSIEEGSTPYYEQRQMECEHLEKLFGGGACGLSKTPNYKKERNGDKRSPFKNSAENKLKSLNENLSQKDVIQSLMSEMLTRIEAKQYEENEIKQKLIWLKQKKNKGKPIAQIDNDEPELLQLFETKRIKKEK